MLLHALVSSSSGSLLYHRVKELSVSLSSHKHTRSIGAWREAGYATLWQGIDIAAVDMPLAVRRLSPNRETDGHRVCGSLVCG